MVPPRRTPYKLSTSSLALTSPLAVGQSWGGFFLSEAGPVSERQLLLSRFIGRQCPRSLEGEWSADEYMARYLADMVMGHVIERVPLSREDKECVMRWL